MRGVGGYNVAMLEGMSEWGVSCHFVDAEFDTGDLVEVERFPIDPDTATAFSLDLESQERLFELFKRVIGARSPARSCRARRRARAATCRARSSRRCGACGPGDDLDRKLRAFWYPPCPGAVVEVDGQGADARGRASCWQTPPRAYRDVRARCRNLGRDGLRGVRNRESGRRALLHELRRRRSSGAAPAAAPRRPPRRASA